MGHGTFIEIDMIWQRHVSGKAKAHSKDIHLLLQGNTTWRIITEGYSQRTVFSWWRIYLPAPFYLHISGVITL